MLMDDEIGLEGFPNEIQLFRIFQERLIYAIIKTFAGTFFHLPILLLCFQDRSVLEQCHHFQRHALLQFFD